MKAGKLVHVIGLERLATTVDGYGGVEETWTGFATMRAEIVERSTEEFLRAAGETDVTTIVFRTRFLAGLTNNDRVSFDGEHFDIEEVIPIGRRRGLELRCVATGGE